MMGERVHMSMDVRGAILNRSFDGFINDEGTPATRRQAADFLMDELAKGHLFIPLSKDCDNFDPKKGCLGHPIPDECPVKEGA